MKISKVIMPIATAAVLVGYVVKKGKIPTKLFEAASNITQVASDTTINAEKSFGGLTQSAINKIIDNTPRAVKAVIEGEILEYFYSSGSGKHVYSSKMSFDSEGKLNYEGTPFLGGNAPSIFVDMLLKARKENNENL